MFENKTRKMIVALAVGLLLSVVLSVGVVAAGPMVLGNVRNQDTSDPLEGASVYATCNGNTVGPTTTNTYGYYELDLTTTGCSVGQTVDVEATYSGNTGSGSGQLQDAAESGFMQVDFTIVCVDIPIPEFATIAIPVASILGLVLFFNHRKRKRE